MTIHRVLVVGCALVSLAACGDDTGGPASRPDAAEKNRRLPLVAEALGLSINDGADAGELSCILDDAYDQIGYQVGTEGTNSTFTVAAAVTTCSIDEFTELPRAIATAHRADVAEIRALVITATEALLPD